MELIRHTRERLDFTDRPELVLWLQRAVILAGLLLAGAGLYRQEWVYMPIGIALVIGAFFAVRFLPSFISISLERETESFGFFETMPFRKAPNVVKIPFSEIASIKIEQPPGAKSGARFVIHTQQAEKKILGERAYGSIDELEAKKILIERFLGRNIS